MEHNYVLVKGESKSVIELRDFKSQENIIYTKLRVKVPGGTYVSKLLDPITQAVLAEVQGKKSSTKSKQLLLYQPDDCIELKDSGILTFEHKFFWENKKYVWKKRNIVSKELECKMVHGDDPGIGVCIYKLYKQESKTLDCITVMYYNMERISVKDKKGLEYLLVMSLLTILDKWDDDRSKNEVILSSESSGEIHDKDDEKKLSEETAILHRKLKEVQEKEDEELAIQLQMNLSDPNYNENNENEEEGSTSNNSRKSSISPISTYSFDSSVKYKYITESAANIIRPPTPPSEQEEYDKRHPLLPTPTSPAFPSSVYPRPWNVKAIILTASLAFTLVFLIALSADHRKEAEILKSDAARKIKECSLKYVENRCNPATRALYLEEDCIFWENCMNQDPNNTVKSSEIYAKQFARIISVFLENLSYEARIMFICFVTIFSYIVVIKHHRTDFLPTREKD